VLGGWLVDDVSWRWIFYVNIPIGAVALVLAFRILKPDTPQPTQKLDALGLALLSPGLALLVYGLSETASAGGLGSAQAGAPVLAGVLLLAAFARHALRVLQPLIDVRLFRGRAVAAPAIAMVLFACAFFGAMLIVPLYYQVVHGLTALQAGLMVLPQGVGAAITMVVGGRVVDRTGAKRVVLPGLVAIAAGMAVFTQVGADTSLWLLGGAAFLIGLGMGASMMPTMASAYQSLTRPQVARATTAFNIIQRGGGAIGIALLSVVLANQLAARLPGAAGAGEGLAAAQQASASAQAQAAPLIAEAFGHTFAWAVVLVLLAVIPAWFLPWNRPPASEAQDAAAAHEPEPAPVPVEA
jgi:EmrB/QacA subfamily drug resistance transporter